MTLTYFSLSAQTFTPVPVVVGKIDKIGFSPADRTAFNGVTVRVTNPSTGYNCQTLTQNYTNFPKIPVNQPLISQFFLKKNGVFYCEMPSVIDNAPTPIQIFPSRNWDWLNGVTTFDLVEIRKHVLNLQLLDTYNRLIAADVNFSKSITSFDLSILQGLILGNSTGSGLPSESWEFIDEYPLSTVTPSGLVASPSGIAILNNTPFTAPLYPWGLLSDGNHTVNYPALNGPVVFPTTIQAIKMGDVNGSSTIPGAAPQGSDRIAKSIVQSSNPLKKGDVVEISVSADNFSQIVGMQFGLKFDTDYLKLLKIEKGSIPSLSLRDNFGLDSLAKGEIRVVWTEENLTPTHLGTSDKMMLLKFEVTQDLDNVANVLVVSDRVLPMEFSEMNKVVNDVILNLNNNTYTVEANSVIAYPNPFNETLSFRIQAKEYANASITFFDASGRVVLEEKNKVSEGVNWMNIENSNALPTGLVLYTIQIGDEITRGKIFKLK
jgi:hypothetical protein